MRFITILVLIIGALNWGLWGFFQYDFIEDIFGSDSSAWARVCYAIIGLFGLYGVKYLFVKSKAQPEK